jgi:hypothetical protein
VEAIVENARGATLVTLREVDEILEEQDLTDQEHGGANGD